MKNPPVNSAENKAKPAKDRARLAKAVVAKRAYSKSARQNAFKKLAHLSSAAEAVSQAKLISGVNSSQFRIVRMPG
jgi:type IV secretory pathway component VirB8